MKKLFFINLLLLLVIGMGFTPAAYSGTASKAVTYESDIVFDFNFMPNELVEEKSKKKYIMPPASVSMPEGNVRITVRLMDDSKESSKGNFINGKQSVVPVTDKVREDLRAAVEKDIVDKTNKKSLYNAVSEALLKFEIARLKDAEKYEKILDNPKKDAKDKAKAKIKYEKDLASDIKTLNKDYRKALSKIKETVKKTVKKELKSMASKVKKTTPFEPFTYTYVDGAIINKLGDKSIANVLGKAKGSGDEEPDLFMLKVKPSVKDNGKSLEIESRMRLVSHDYEFINEDRTYVELVFSVPSDIDDNHYAILFHEVISPFMQAKGKALTRAFRGMDREARKWSRENNQEKLKATLGHIDKKYAETITEIRAELPGKIKARLGQFTGDKYANWQQNAVSVLKVGASTAKIGLNIAKLVGTCGADPTAWIGIANEVVSIGKVLKENFQSIATDQKKVADCLVELDKVLSLEKEGRFSSWYQKQNVIAKLDDLESALTTYRAKIRRTQNKVSDLTANLHVLLDCQQYMPDGTEKAKVLEIVDNMVDKQIPGMNAVILEHQEYTRQILLTVQKTREVTGMGENGLVKRWFKCKFAQLTTKLSVQKNSALLAYTAVKSISGLAGVELPDIATFVTAAENLKDGVVAVAKKVKK